MNLYRYVLNAISEKLGFMVRLEVPKNKEFGDFSTNAAMVGAKLSGKKPFELATDYISLLKNIDFIEDATIAGPGFINIKLKDSFLIQNYQTVTKIANQDIKKIDLDYGGYNVGKALHIGHMRTTIVGDTFNRIAKFMGHKTKSYNHIGDWGRPMGLIIVWILEYGMPKNSEELNKIYPASSAKAKEDETWMTKAREATAELQSGNPKYKQIYDTFMKMSLKQMDEILQRMNIIPFDMTMGERGVADYVADTQKILESKHLLESSEGALIVNVKKDTDTAPMPPLMFRTSSDTQTYAAADLSAIYYRENTDKPDIIGYFTDSRQALHFQQVFRVAKLADITTAELFHTGFGSLTGTDGKPFKTRDGGVANLIDILNTSRDAVKNRVVEAGKQLDEETIEQIALAAVKFNDLIHDVKSDYVFDPNSVTSFEGRTGPYILYTAVRLNSVLNKINIQPQISSTTYQLKKEERNLLIQILDFERIVTFAYENRATDIIANYAYDLCQTINTFYHNCPIIKNDLDPIVQKGRVYITQVARDTLSTIISLMGLVIPKEM